MNIYLNFKLINTFSNIFTIKVGKIVKFEKKYYQLNTIISNIFKFYYNSGICAFSFIFLFLLQPHYFDNLLFRIAESILIYIFIESLITLILPIKEVSQYKDLKKEIEERENNKF